MDISPGLSLSRNSFAGLSSSFSSVFLLLSSQSDAFSNTNTISRKISRDVLRARQCTTHHLGCAKLPDTLFHFTKKLLRWPACDALISLSLSLSLSPCLSLSLSLSPSSFLRVPILPSSFALLLSIFFLCLSILRSARLSLRFKLSPVELR